MLMVFEWIVHSHFSHTHTCTDDMESEKVHLAGIVVRDLSVAVSNYRSVMSLDEYCKQQVSVGACRQACAPGRHALACLLPYS